MGAADSCAISEIDIAISASARVTANLKLEDVSFSLLLTTLTKVAQRQPQMMKAISGREILGLRRGFETLVREQALGSNPG